MEDLKQHIRSLVMQGDLKEALRCFLDRLPAGDPQLNVASLLVSRHATLETKEISGTIDYREADLERNKITAALLELLQTYQHTRTPKFSVPSYHAFTCNRNEQSELFQVAYYTGTGAKVRFFYLYGDARQGHESLYQRLGYEINNCLYDPESPAPGLVKAPIFEKLKTPVHKNPLLYQINIIKELLIKFKISPRQPVQQVKITELLRSPDLQGCTAEDTVFILLTIDDYNWDAEITPKVVREFIEGFCNAELPVEAPSFFFFFGIEYQKSNEKTKEEVAHAIRERHYGEGLPELSPVLAADINEWFSRYRFLIPGGKTYGDMTHLLFGESYQMDMLDVEVRLKKIIDDHNMGFVLRS
jgi:hypothetical protein